VRYRLFGTSGLRVSELFLGAMTFGEQGGVGAPPSECAQMLDVYADAGGNVIDTAINYRGGASEEILGKLLAGRRDRFVLSTKYGVSRDGSDPNAAGSSRKNLRLSLETSLRRLATDYIDIYWVHIWDANTPVEETMRALDDAVRAGKILHLGISDAPSWLVARANTLAQWHGWTPLSGVQVPYSLLRRDIEREILPMAVASGMSMAVWGPLADGVLSGKFTGPAGRPARSRISPESVSQEYHAAVRTVQEVASSCGATSAQVAIAWLLTRGPAIHPIIGARSSEQLADNLGALKVELTEEMISRLDAVAGFDPGFPRNFIEQTRAWVYGEAGGRVVPRDGQLT
jgi:aryl-alcohol dehydrogenase-like predicted oxidoreductase